jgi:hypothetical protein
MKVLPTVNWASVGGGGGVGGGIGAGGVGAGSDIVPDTAPFLFVVESVLFFRKHLRWLLS